MSNEITPASLDECFLCAEPLSELGNCKNRKCRSCAAYRPLTPALREKRREAGRKGYVAVVSRLGQTEFHRRGGNLMRRLDLYTAPDGSVGYDAAVRYGVHTPRGKKHRY